MTDSNKDKLKPLYRDELGYTTHVPELIGDKDNLDTSFTSVTKRIQELKKKFSLDNISVEKYLKFLQSNLIDIDESTRAKLSQITKEIGNTILNFYEEKSMQINDQRSENLKLQLELSSLIKEKNSIQHEVRNLLSSVRKMEGFLGVDADDEFDSHFPTGIK